MLTTLANCGPVVSIDTWT